MQVTRLRLRDFRCYAAADLPLGPGLTVIHGRNGAGKTNLLEGLYFGLTARSCRTNNEREVVRFGEGAARVEVEVADDDGLHELAVGFQPGEAKRLRADGAPVERLVDVAVRPLVSVFLPDRLELVKGAPALRRAHLDQVVAAAWPSRGGTRRAYTQALAQRNALLSRVRGGRASRSSLPAWDAELARHGIVLRDDRAAAVDLVRDRFAAIAGDLGLTGAAELRYKPRSSAATAEELTAELAEREALGEARGQVPLLLLDDVMSELDADRRALLVERLGDRGQAVITTTDLAHVPGADRPTVTRIAVAEGSLLQAAPEAA